MNTMINDKIDGQPFAADKTIKALLHAYHAEVKGELKLILYYWANNTIDNINGGFTGQIDENNVPHPDMPKGAVLNSRILWAFSSAFTLINDAGYLDMAAVAFKYITNYFIDKKYGGVYWTVDAAGLPLDTKKQIYALAFAIYGCSAYYVASNNEEAKNAAISLFATIEKYSFDDVHTGYMEAFTKEWQPMHDLRLSDKDANEKKTMNTHLHVLEAYTALYRIWPDEKLKERLVSLINNFIQYIVDNTTGHLILFFDEAWHRKSEVISYGHDIEAAWLLVEAAEVAGDVLLIEQVKAIAVKISAAATEGLDKDGGLWYEFEPSSHHLIKEKHWWVQAEAMVGFLNHWQLTHDETYLQRSLLSWHYVRSFIKDKTYGEWLWGRNADGTIMKGQDKVGIWKCPYHNARACIEIIKRIDHLMPQ